MYNHCEIHHLTYHTNECPLCSKERIEKYSKKWNYNIQDNKKYDDRDITYDDLIKLKNKFQ